jgi:hypothetical protein
MVKVIIIGEQPSKTKNKGIEFHEFLTAGEIPRVANKSSNHIPKNFDYIELICRRYDQLGNYDLMFAYNNPDKREEGVLFLGKFNDGIIL